MMERTKEANPYSSTFSFVQQVAPKISVFTVGKNNRWGFPKAKVLEVYAAIGSQIYRTDRHGAISILSSANDLKVTSKRKHRYKLWY